MTPSIASGADKMASADHPGSVAASSKPALGGDRHLTARFRRKWTTSPPANADICMREQVPAGYFPSSAALSASAAAARHARHNNTFGRVGPRTRCDQACRQGRRMAAPTRVPHEVPWQDYDLPALDGMSSAELILAIVYSAARRVDWWR